MPQTVQTVPGVPFFYYLLYVFLDIISLLCWYFIQTLQYNQNNWAFRIFAENLWQESLLILLLVSSLSCTRSRLIPAIREMTSADLVQKCMRGTSHQMNQWVVWQREGTTENQQPKKTSFKICFITNCDNKHVSTEIK